MDPDVKERFNGYVAQFLQGEEQERQKEASFNERDLENSEHDLFLENTMTTFKNFNKNVVSVAEKFKEYEDCTMMQTFDQTSAFMMDDTRSFSNTYDITMPLNVDNSESSSEEDGYPVTEPRSRHWLSVDHNDVDKLLSLAETMKELSSNKTLSDHDNDDKGDAERIANKLDELGKLYEKPEVCELVDKLQKKMKRLNSEIKSTRALANSLNLDRKSVWKFVLFIQQVAWKNGNQDWDLAVMKVYKAQKNHSWTWCLFVISKVSGQDCTFGIGK